MNSRPQNKAFTLVEMLMGLAIIGMIVSMVYGSYAATTRSLEVYGDRMTCGDRAHLVLRLLARQLRCAYAPPAPASSTGTPTLPGRSNLRPGPLSPSGVSGSSEIVFQGDPREVDGEVLSFLTTAGLSQAPGKPSGPSRVSYRYEARKGVLSLCCEPGVYSSDRRRDSHVWWPVLSGITNIDLEFYDGQQWQPTWGSPQITKLPRAARVLLAVADESGRKHRYETAVVVACAGSTPKQPSRRQAGQR